MSFGAPGWSFVTNVTTIINPTLTNEFVFGSSRNDLHITPITDAFNASKVGVSYTMPFPDADKLKLVQNWNFGGVPNGPTTGFAGTPFLNFNHTYDITDSVAKVHNTHTFKGGIYLHKSLKDQTAFTSVNGIINFDRDANNPQRHQLGVLQRAARQLRYAAAVQPGAERPVPLLERRVVCPGQLARHQETHARIRHPLLLGAAAIRQGAADVLVEQGAVRSGQRRRAADRGARQQRQSRLRQSDNRRKGPGGADRLDRE